MLLDEKKEWKPWTIKLTPETWNQNSKTKNRFKTNPKIMKSIKTHFFYINTFYFFLFFFRFVIFEYFNLLQPTWIIENRFQTPTLQHTFTTQTERSTHLSSLTREAPPTQISTVQYSSPIRYQDKITWFSYPPILELRKIEIYM